MSKFLDKAGLDTFWAKIKSTFQTLGNLVTSWGSTPSDTKYPSEKLVKTSLDGKQNTLPTSGTASSTYAINISGTAGSVKPNSMASGYVDLSFSGVTWEDFAGTGTNSLFAKIPWVSDASKSAHIYGRIYGLPDDWVTKTGLTSTSFGLFVAYKARDAYVVEVNQNPKGTSITRCGVLRIHLSSSSGIVRLEKLVTANTTAVGSSSIPTYVNQYGVITACTAKDACNAFINALDTGSSTPVDADYYVSQYVGGGTTTTTYHRRPMSAMWTYIKGKLTSVSGVNISGNAATATSLYRTAISYHRPVASGGDGKQWCRLATLTEANIATGGLWYGVGVIVNLYVNPYGVAGQQMHFGTYELVFKIGISAGSGYSLKTKGDMGIRRLHGPDRTAAADGRSGIDWKIVRSDTKVEFFIKNSEWDSALYIEKVQEVNSAGTRWVWKVENGLYTDDEFATYCSDKTTVDDTIRLTYKSNALVFPRKSSFNYNNWTQAASLITAEVNPTDATNAPSANWFYLLSMQGEDSAYAGQMAFRMTGDPGLFIRQRKASAWGSWSRLLTTGDVTSTYSATGTSPVNGTAVASAISDKASATHTHGNIANDGTLTDTAAAAAGNDYVVIRDADNAKIQTSTIKGTDVADAVSKKHSHSTLTLSTTAQAYDGSHTLALPSTDPYTSARTPASHTHGNITNGGALQTNDIAIASGDKLIVTDSSDSNKVARTSVSFDGSTTTKALTQKGTFESFAKAGDITTAIQALDVSSVGGAGKYISAISETDGKISATATTMDTTPTASSTNAVTSGGIKTALDGKANDADVVHKTGTETITGIKTFNNAVSPRQTGDGFMKQSKVFIGSVITPYADWTASQKDGNHYRTWTIDLTSVIVASSTHGNIVVKMMGSYYNTPGNGTLVKEITFQIYNGNVVITKGDYTVAQSPCADEFAISDVFKSGSNYVIQVVNRKPTANNYPLRLEIEMFNRYASAVLDNVTVAEAITEGLPSWAVKGASVIATKVDTRWFYHNEAAGNDDRWYKLLSVTHESNTHDYAGDIFAVTTRDAGDNNVQALLAFSPYAAGSDQTAYAKLVVLNMRTNSLGPVVFKLARPDNTHYTIYAMLPKFSGVKIAPVACDGAIVYESDSYTSEPSGLAPVDKMVNTYTSSAVGVGSSLQPTYVGANGLVAPCSTLASFAAIHDIGSGTSGYGDTSLTPVVPDYIYCQEKTDLIRQYSLNIQRLIEGKVYKVMFGNGGNSVEVLLMNHYNNDNHDFTVHHGSGSTVVGYWDFPDGSHSTSYTSHIMRTGEHVYIIDGY